MLIQQKKISWPLKTSTSGGIFKSEMYVTCSMPVTLKERRLLSVCVYRVSWHVQAYEKWDLNLDFFSRFFLLSCVLQCTLLKCTLPWNVRVVRVHCWYMPVRYDLSVSRWDYRVKVCCHIFFKVKFLFECFRERNWFCSQPRTGIYDLIISSTMFRI